MNRTMRTGFLVVVLWALTLGPCTSLHATPLLGPEAPEALSLPSEVINLINEGLAKLNASDLDGAEAAFTAASKKVPIAVDPILGLAEVALARKDGEAVEFRLQQALKIAPHSAKVQRALGRWRFSTGDFRRAARHLYEASRLDPGDIEAHVDLGDVLLNGLGAPRSAEIAYRESVALVHDHAGAHYGLGIALARQRRFDEAILAFKRAIALVPRSNPLPIIALARAYLSMGRTDDALEIFESLAERNPNNPAAQVGRGDALAARGDKDAALAAYRDATAASPGHAVAHLRMGMLLQQAGRIREAESSYLNAVATDERQVRAWNNLAWMAAARGERLNDAVEWGKRAVALAPMDPTVVHTLANVYLVRGDAGRAVEVVEKASAGEPPNPELYFLLGNVLSEAKRLDQALVAYRRALSVDAEFPYANRARERIAALRAAGAR